MHHAPITPKLCTSVVYPQRVGVAYILHTLAWAALGHSVASALTDHHVKQSREQPMHMAQSNIAKLHRLLRIHVLQPQQSQHFSSN